MPRFRTRAALLAGLALALACSRDTTGPDTQDVLAHRRKWDAQGLTSYTYEFRRSCFCVYEPALVDVRSGLVWRVTSLTTGKPIPLEDARSYPTISQEFDQILELNHAGRRTDVSWDGGMGYPTHVSIHTDEPGEHWADSLAAVHSIPPGS